MKNYYEILEVSENASPEVIEKAYRTLAKKYHPDMWPKDRMFFAEMKFKEITEAYEVLSNETSRYNYDLKLGLNTTLDDKYNTLYSEHEKLKQEVNDIKAQNISNQYINNSSNTNRYVKPRIFNIKKIASNIKSAIQNEANKPKDERARDFKALIITIIIVSILLFAFWKIPFLKKILFP